MIDGRMNKGWIDRLLDRWINYLVGKLMYGWIEQWKDR